MISNIKLKTFDGKRIVTNSYNYCTICGSVNVKVSARGNKYCGDICWKDPKYKNKRISEYRDMLEEQCGGEVCIDY